MASSREAMSRWGVAPGGCNPGVKKLLLKGTGEARCRPPRGRAWLRDHMVSKRSDERPTGNPPPVRGKPTQMSWTSLTVTVPTPSQGRPRATEAACCIFAAQRMSQMYLDYPDSSQEPATSRIGSEVSHHLRDLAESIYVNVGGLHAEVSSPPANHASVGGVIVLGGWESHLQGEGRQLVEIPTQHNRVRTGMKFP